VETAGDQASLLRVSVGVVAAETTGVSANWSGVVCVSMLSAAHAYSAIEKWTQTSRIVSSTVSRLPQIVAITAQNHCCWRYSTRRI